MLNSADFQRTIYSISKPDSLPGNSFMTFSIKQLLLKNTYNSKLKIIIRRNSA